MNAIPILVYLFLGYLALGAVFAPLFVAFGIHRVDATARASSWGFRLLVLPGAVALWPLLATRWARGGGEPPAERNAHRDAATLVGHREPAP